MVFSSGRFYSISLLTPIRINLHLKIGQMGLRSWRNYGAAWVRVGGGEKGGRRGKLTLRALAHRKMECSSLYKNRDKRPPLVGTTDLKSIAPASKIIIIKIIYRSLTCKNLLQLPKGQYQSVM